MNLPNKLTIMRIVLVPFFVAFLLIEQIPFHSLFALILFIIASITDAADGHIARSRGLVTDFGKFLDPLADKILVISAMICFMDMGLAPAVAVIIIVCREFIVTALRLAAVSSNGNVIAAGILGKIKTASSMVALIGIMLLSALSQFAVLPGWIDVRLVSHILMWGCAAITFISGMQYIIVNRKYITPKK